MSYLHLNLDFSVEMNKFYCRTNIKPNRIDNIIEEFLRTQIGEGKDTSPANTEDLLSIDITLDLSDDTFIVNHTCGNKGLRDGILVHYLKKAWLNNDIM